MVRNLALRLVRLRNPRAVQPGLRVREMVLLAYAPALLPVFFSSWRNDY